MVAITSEMKVGEFVRNWPQTMQVFRTHGLNLQCGGTHSVSFAADKHGYDLEMLLADLNSAVRDAALPKL